MTTFAENKLKSVLKKYTLINLIQKIIPVPISLFTAVLTSKIFTNATDGNLSNTLKGSIVLFTITIAHTGLNVFF